jgi:hypothetical protein
LDTTNKHQSERVTFFVGTYGYGVTSDFIAKRQQDESDSFRSIFLDNPFIQLSGAPSGFVMGYENWIHARHVTNLNGCKRHLIALLKVELNVDTLTRLVANGQGKVVRDASPERIWQISLHDLLKVADDEVTFTVLAATSYAAVALNEFALPDALVSQLRSARADCLQSLIIALIVDENNYSGLLEQHGLNVRELVARLTERAQQLSDEERQALVGLI